MIHANVPSIIQHLGKSWRPTGKKDEDRLALIGVIRLAAFRRSGRITLETGLLGVTTFADRALHHTRALALFGRQPHRVVYPLGRGPKTCISADLSKCSMRSGAAIGPVHNRPTWDRKIMFNHA